MATRLLNTMKATQNVLLFLTFLTSCLAIALLAASLGTESWIVSDAQRPSNPKAQGTINFGLFHGTRRLNHGFGERIYPMNVFQVQYREQNFMIRELYVTTIVCVGVAILFGLISGSLALYNISTIPSEAVCHYPGLVAFNVIGFLSSLVAIITWIIQYFIKFRGNVLIREDQLNGGWKSEGLASVGYSFWMVFVASVIFFLNSVIVLILQKRFTRGRRTKNHIIDNTKPTNGNLMLY
ncbi:hypothetical protein TCAL_01660 [Tigriopus californicus]|uniref:MARVEL domain-containing protein n=1 Tax=Tigriopus californicus TaxID=6832 RepID=A0A553PBV3_TIGCA|nr:uncharacterized protein LOC131892860 [Tigriopus californicus]TRY75162.1 hypothetical protein TCAL_01660 [Tigriopus californicus]